MNIRNPPIGEIKYHPIIGMIVPANWIIIPARNNKHACLSMINRKIIPRLNYPPKELSIEWIYRPKIAQSLPESLGFGFSIKSLQWIIKGAVWSVGQEIVFINFGKERERGNFRFQIHFSNYLGNLNVLSPVNSYTKVAGEKVTGVIRIPTWTFLTVPLNYLMKPTRVINGWPYCLSFNLFDIKISNLILRTHCLHLYQR